MKFAPNTIFITKKEDLTSPPLKMYSHCRCQCETKKTQGLGQKHLDREHLKWALCCILGTKYFTCSYIDKFAPFHNQMTVIYNIFFFKFPQTIYFYEAESARKIDAQLNFQHTGCLL